MGWRMRLMLGEGGSLRNELMVKSGRRERCDVHYGRFSWLGGVVRLRSLAYTGIE